MQKLSILFWIIVAGIVLSLGMTIYTGTKHKASETPISIPTPAMALPQGH